MAVPLNPMAHASNGWLAERLDMGSGVDVSKHMGRLNRGTGRGRDRLANLPEGER